MSLPDIGPYLPASRAARAGVNPGRTYQPLNIKSSAPPRRKKRLDTDQIVAIVLGGLILLGIFFMVLAFVGVFNESGPTVQLTPALTAPENLPVTVTVA